jgi:hypothetical protein
VRKPDARWDTMGVDHHGRLGHSLNVSGWHVVRVRRRNYAHQSRRAGLATRAVDALSVARLSFGGSPRPVRPGCHFDCPSPLPAPVDPARRGD